jgi:nitrous oxidase accessory protein
MLKQVFIFLTQIIFLAVMFEPALGQRIVVSAGTDLQATIHAASPGDTLLMGDGVWNKNPYIILKPLTFIGSGSTRFEAIEVNSIFHVQADSVRFINIHFSGVKSSSIIDNAAILVELGNYCEIRDNRFEKNYFGIYLKDSHYCTIANNQIESDAISESSAGNGIHLWKSKGVVIDQNDIQGHRDGIYLEFADSVIVKRNSSHKNIRYGLHYMFSNNCTYSNNRFEKNGAGVAVMYSNQVLMENNEFLTNWGPTSYGLLLKDINDSKIVGNLIQSNTTGIHSEGSNRVLIQSNRFVSNGKAVVLMASSNDNNFLQNDFIDNTLDVSTNSRNHYNFFESNYWSAYAGYDLDRDGVGDIQHRPVRLFAYIIERNPVAMVLLRSLFIELLDAAEKVFPVLSPKMLVDVSPSMKPHMS